MDAITQYGVGDQETWAPCTGHPNDPRTDDESAAAEIEAEAAVVWARDVADLDDPSLIRISAISEALGDLVEDADLRQIAELMRDRQYSAIGILVAGRIEGYWERLCRERAEERIEAANEWSAKWRGGGSVLREGSVMAIRWIRGLPPSLTTQFLKSTIQPEFEIVGEPFNTRLGAIDAPEDLPAGASYRCESIQLGFSMQIQFRREA